MTKEKLIRALETAEKRARTEILSASREPGRAQWAYISEETKRIVIDAISGFEPVASVLGSFIECDHTSLRLSIDSAAVYLIDRALEARPADIVSSLLEFCDDMTVEIVHVRAFDGVTITAPIDLGDGMSILPPANAPKCELTATIFSPQFQRQYDRTAAGGAVVITESEAFKIGTPPPPGEMPPIRQPRMLDEKRWVNALYALSLVSGAPLHYREQYRHVTTLGWPFMDGGGFGGGSNIQWESPRFPVDAVKCRTVFEQLNRHPKPDKVALACKKLLASRSRTDLAERIIDQGTCMELLLIDEKSDSGEIKNKVCTRAAWILGEDFATRKRVYDVAADLYNGRSKAVHSGAMPKSTLKTDMSKLEMPTTLHDRLCADLVMKIASLSAWPKWTELVLGG